MTISLLDNSLKISIFKDIEDNEFADNICFRFTESCPEDEKIFFAGETNIYLTREQAKLILEELQNVLKAD